MKDSTFRAWPLSPSLRWLLWLTCLLISTAVLVGPSLSQMLRQQIASGENTQLDYELFLISKIFHVGDYTLLAMLTAWLPWPRGGRMLLLAFLSLHAAGTEYFQQFVESRTGTLRDVGLDHIGLVLGAVLMWKWWHPKPAGESASLRGA